MLWTNSVMSASQAGLCLKYPQVPIGWPNLCLATIHTSTLVKESKAQLQSQQKQGAHAANVTLSMVEPAGQLKMPSLNSASSIQVLPPPAGPGIYLRHSMTKNTKILLRIVAQPFCIPWMVHSRGSPSTRCHTTRGPHRAIGTGEICPCDPDSSWSDRHVVITRGHNKQTEHTAINFWFPKRIREFLSSLCKRRLDGPANSWCDVETTDVAVKPRRNRSKHNMISRIHAGTLSVTVPPFP